MRNYLVTGAVFAALGSGGSDAAVLPPTTPIDFVLYAGGAAAQVNAVYVSATAGRLLNGFGIDSSQGVNGSTSTNYDNTPIGNYTFIFTNSFNHRTKVPGHFSTDGTANGQAIPAFLGRLLARTQSHTNR